MWRVWAPFAELTRRGFIADWCHKEESMKVLPLIASGRYDAVLTPRIVWPIKDIGEKWVNSIHNAGLAWLYEIDDDVFSPAIIPRQTKLFAEEAAKGYDQLEWERNERIRLLAICDGVTVTTRRLKTMIGQYAPEAPVYVVPNAIDVAWFKLVLRGIGRVPELEGKLTIGWAGGTREDVDLLVLGKAWTVLAEKYPHVMFVAQGHLSSVLADAVPKERRLLLPWLPLDEYPRALVNIDIGCCVVAPMVFNSSKSCIKWYEMTLAGAACVVSPMVYGNEVTDGVDALVASSVDEWIEKLSILVESEELRRSVAREARRTVVTEHSLQNNVLAWPEAWKEAIEAFHDKRSRQLVFA
jgi:glycosyltransferase involved in cell wall biosynthesis